MAVWSRSRSDGAERYEDVESGLNRMSLRKFDRLLKSSGLSVVRRTVVLPRPSQVVPALRIAIK